MNVFPDFKQVATEIPMSEFLKWDWDIRNLDGTAFDVEAAKVALRMIPQEELDLKLRNEMKRLIDEGVLVGTYTLESHWFIWGTGRKPVHALAFKYSNGQTEVVLRSSAKRRKAKKLFKAYAKSMKTRSWIPSQQFL